MTGDGYDNNGNTTNSSGNSYQYGVMNHVINVNNGTILITYDGDGNRVSKTIAATGTTTYYLLDDRNPSGYVQVLEEYQSLNCKRHAYTPIQRSDKRRSITATMNMTPTDEAILKTDVLGRVRTPRERREHLLDEFERSGLSGQKFAVLAGIKYRHLRRGRSSGGDNAVLILPLGNARFPPDCLIKYGGWRRSWKRPKSGWQKSPGRDGRIARRCPSGDRRCQTG